MSLLFKTVTAERCQECKYWYVLDEDNPLECPYCCIEELEAQRDDCKRAARQEQRRYGRIIDNLQRKYEALVEMHRTGDHRGVKDALDRALLGEDDE